jgi:hypothetical protein
MRQPAGQLTRCSALYFALDLYSNTAAEITSTAIYLFIKHTHARTIAVAAGATAAAGAAASLTRS